MLEENYWRQDSGFVCFIHDKFYTSMFRNCQYLLHYQAIGLPLPVYNHNLDKILQVAQRTLSKVMQRVGEAPWSLGVQGGGQLRVR